MRMGAVGFWLGVGFWWAYRGVERLGGERAWGALARWGIGRGGLSWWCEAVAMVVWFVSAAIAVQRI